MSLPLEFKSLKDIQLLDQQQIDFYRTAKSEPIAHIYRGMGTYWVICRSLQNSAKFNFSILGGPNPFHCDENHRDHVKNNIEPNLSAAECAKALECEMLNFFK